MTHLLTLLRQPQPAPALTLSQWDLLIRQAQAAGLLAHLATRLAGQTLPVAVQNHLCAARRLAEAQKRTLRWELHCLCEALSAVPTPIILLKGAAYILGELPAGRGRLVNDLDILVERSALDAVEAALHLYGWVSVCHDAYDQRYYRQWMHELPPMRHVQRMTALDVHHNILPDSARLHPDRHKLLAAAQDIPGAAVGVKILAPADMILHSAVHLFNDGEFGYGLRDLCDLDSLLRHFGAKPGFWEALALRASEMELQRPLYYALQHAERLLNTPLPEGLLDQQPGAKPAWPVRALSHFMFSHGLQPVHPSCSNVATSLARWLLYVRAHYLRMPLHLLIPHLLRKAVKREEAPSA